MSLRAPHTQRALPPAADLRYPDLLKGSKAPAGTWFTALAMIAFGFFAVGLTNVIILQALSPGSNTTADGFTLLVANVSLLLMVPVVLFAYAWAGRSAEDEAPKRKLSAAHSVTGRFRWRLFLVAIAVCVVFEALSVLIQTMSSSEPLAGEPKDLTGLANNTVFIMVVVLTTSALQSAGEEYLFRGALTQVLGRVLPAVAAIVASGLLFMLSHGIMPWDSPALFTTRFGYAIIVSVVSVLTGGLEAPVAIHAMNNIVVFGYTALFGDLNATLAPGDAPWPTALIEVTKFALEAVVITLIARRMAVATRPDPESGLVAGPDSGILRRRPGGSPSTPAR